MLIEVYNKYNSIEVEAEVEAEVDVEVDVEGELEEAEVEDLDESIVLEEDILNN